LKESQMENPRTTSAREHDGSDIIDTVEPAPPQGGRSGGNLQTDIGTEASLDRVRDPEAHDGVDKQDDIDHAQRYPGQHTGGESFGGGSSD
jgi:hypothetical protein